MPEYSYGSEDLVDAKMTIRPVGQPSSSSGLSSAQQDTSPPLGGCSAHAHVVTASSRPDANVSSSSTWTPVAGWNVHPNFVLPGWVDVESAGNENVVLQQTNSSASSTQQAAMPSAFNMQYHVLATPGGQRTLTNEQYCEAARRILRACTIMGGAHCSVNRYIALFGIPGKDRETMFGTHIAHRSRRKCAHTRRRRRSKRLMSKPRLLM